MKKQLLLLPLLFLSLAGAFAQAHFNDPNAQLRTVSGFHAVKVSNGIELHLIQSDQEAVAVSASDPEFRDKMKTEVVDGVLKIYFDEAWWRQWSHMGQKKKLRAYVSFRSLDGVDASSGAEVQVEGSLKGQSLKLEASSGATFHGQVDLQSMEVDLSSGAVVEVSGTVKGQLKADGSSGSVFRGYGLQADTCDAETSSGAGIQITVNRELSVHASSGGYVHFKGQGLIRNVHTSSGGTVSRKS